MYRYRRNPGNIGVLVKALRDIGRGRAADLVEKYQDDAEIRDLLNKIADRVAELLEKKKPKEEAFTDRKAWEYLAKISGEVGAQKGWPAELISGLKAAFQAKAAAA